MQPLVQSLALGGLQQHKAWAGHALNALQSAGPLQLQGWAGARAAREQSSLEEVASDILSAFQGPLAPATETVNA